MRDERRAASRVVFGDCFTLPAVPVEHSRYCCTAHPAGRLSRSLAYPFAYPFANALRQCACRVMLIHRAGDLPTNDGHFVFAIDVPFQLTLVNHARQLFGGLAALRVRQDEFDKFTVCEHSVL